MTRVVTAHGHIDGCIVQNIGFEQLDLSDAETARFSIGLAPQGR